MKLLWKLNRKTLCACGLAILLAGCRLPHRQRPGHYPIFGLSPGRRSLAHSAIWHYKLQRMSGTDFTTSFSCIACNEPERYDIVGATLIVS